MECVQQFSDPKFLLNVALFEENLETIGNPCLINKSIIIKEMRTKMVQGAIAACKYSAEDCGGSRR